MYYYCSTQPDYYNQTLQCKQKAIKVICDAEMLMDYNLEKYNLCKCTIHIRINYNDASKLNLLVSIFSFVRYLILQIRQNRKPVPNNFEMQKLRDDRS